MLCLATAATAVLDPDDVIMSHTWDGGSFTDDKNTFNATNQGTTNATGFIGDAREFSGSGQWVDIDDSNGIFTTAGSLNAWVYADGYGHSSEAWIAGKWGGVGYYEAIFKVDGSDDYVIQWNGGIAATSTSSAPTGVWVMYTAVWNSSGTYLYTNGNLNNSGATTWGGDLATGLDIGRNPDGAQSYWDGRIDEITIWDVDLSASQVSELYNGGAGFQYPFTQSTTDIQLTAIDDFNGSSINNFSVSIAWPNASVTNHTTTNGTISLANISDSTIQINVTYYNVTDYYNLTLYDETITVNATSNIQANMYQAVISLNATEKITGNATTATFYTGSKSGTVFNINAGDHNITAAAAGYYNKTQQFSITALINTSQTITGLYTGEWNITVYNLINSSVVSNYSLNITSLNYTSWAGENSSSTTGSYNFSSINGTYQVVIDAPGYIVQTFNFTVNASTGAVNFSLYTQDSINFTFYDEETQNCLTGYNITVELIGDLMAANYTTTNCTLYVDLLTPQAYTIRYDDENNTYGERFYYFNLTNRSNTAIDLYLLNNGTEGYAAITATVYDNTNFPVEGAIIKALRYYLDSNSYIAVDMGKTNFEGVTTLNLKQNEEFYKFIIEYPMGTTKKTTDPTQIYADTLNFQILIGSETGERWYKSVDTIANVTFDEANNWFRLEWNDPENTLSRICLHTDLLTNFRNDTVNDTCSTSAAGVMYHPVDNVTGYTYHSYALAYYSNPPAPVAAAYHTFMATNPIGAIGLFILVLITVAFMFIGKWNIAVAVVLTPIPTMLASVAGIVAIPPYVTVPIQIVACIIAYIISTRA